MKLETIEWSRGKWSGELPQLDSAQSLVIAFGASKFADGSDAISELAARYPSSTVVGCSTSGEIFGTRVQDDSLAVAVAKFEHTNLSVATLAIEDASQSRAVGAELAKRLNAPDLRAVLVLSDGLNVNGSELLKGMNSVLSEKVVITGGLAGDGDRFKRTWVLSDGKPRTGVISAVGFRGEALRVGHGSKGGWDIFGPERTVTRSEGNVLYELDGKPALELYKTYLGDRASGLPATALLFPLSLRRDRDDKNSFVRTILAVNEEKQSMTFAGDIPQGHLAQLMRANFDRLIGGASEAAVMTNSTGGPVLSIAISCVGRRLVLGERTEEEVEAVVEVLPRGSQQIGFYSYGEISPHASGRCELHNQTMTLTTISEG